MGPIRTSLFLLMISMAFGGLNAMQMAKPTYKNLSYIQNILADYIQGRGLKEKSTKTIQDVLGEIHVLMADTQEMKVMMNNLASENNVKLGNASQFPSILNSLRVSLIQELQKRSLQPTAVVSPVVKASVAAQAPRAIPAPIATPVPVAPTAKPAPAIQVRPIIPTAPQPAIQKQPTIPQEAMQRVPASQRIYSIPASFQKIKGRLDLQTVGLQGTVIQLRSFDQADFAAVFETHGEKGEGVAMCPVHALRNAIKLLQYARSGTISELAKIDDLADAEKDYEMIRRFMDRTCWATVEELENSIKQARIPGITANDITVIGSIPEIEIIPELNKQIVEVRKGIKTENYVHAFIVGTSEFAEFSGGKYQRAHYFTVVVIKSPQGLQFVVVDSLQDSNHIASIWPTPDTHYNEQRLLYFIEILEKGSSKINLHEAFKKYIP